MNAAMALARWMGLEVHLEQTLGTMVLDPGAAAWFVGLVLHLAISGLIALLYAWGFEHVARRAGVAVGLLFAVPHLLLAGVFMGAVLPAVHPLVPEVLPAPGSFMLSLGALGAAAFVLLHLLYGAVVGGIYGSVLQPGSASRATA